MKRTEVCIQYGFADTPLGAALLAATPRGLCALRLCQNHGLQEQLQDMRADFGDFEIVESPEAAQIYANQLVAFLTAKADVFQPQLDILIGTTFQRQVWTELQRVAPGETASYTELARRIGRPAAIRAVGSACAVNQIAIAIPCHRAVRSDGSLAGFRWGLDWKRCLLTMESQRRHALPFIL